MAKQSGLGDRLLVGGYDISGDIGSLGAIAGGMEVQEVTGIDKSAKERAGLHRDGRMEFTSFFNPSAGASHKVLSPIPTTDVGVTYLRGAAVGNEAAFMVAKQIGWDPTRGEDGSLEISSVMQANGYGLEWGRQATPGMVTSLASAEVLQPSIDNGAASTFGATLFFQLGPSSATLAAIELQQSSDNGVGDAWTAVASAGVNFAGVVATPSTVRVSVAASLERYLRIRTHGGYASLVYQVTIARRQIATVY